MHVKQIPRGVLVASVAGALLLATAAQATFFFIPDEDSGSLIALLANSIQQLNSLNEQLGTVKKTYAATKQYVGYVEDSVSAFDRLAHWDATRAVQLLEDAVPNLRYFDREAHHLNTWTQGRRELDALLGTCLRARQRQGESVAQAQSNADRRAQGLPTVGSDLADAQVAAGAGVRADDACNQLNRQLTGEQAVQTIADTFGPPRTLRHARMDATVADAIADFEAIRLLDKTLKDQWAAYESYCLDAVDDAKGPGEVTDSVMSKCQASAAAVQTSSARQLQMLRREVSSLKDIEAWRLANDVGKQKDEYSARQREKATLIEGAKSFAPPTIRISGPGFNLLEEK